jgi:propionate CoA-transferase
MLDRIVTPEQAVELIRDGDAVVVGGSSGMGVAESVLEAIEKAFLDRGRPRDLVVIHTTAVGDKGKRGLNRLAHKGLVRRVIGAAYDLLPSVMELIGANEIEAQNLPQGVLCQLYRAIAAGQPGVITHVGLGTYMDPRQDGGKMNAATTEDMIEVVELDGGEWLFYRAPTANIAFIRGTSADEDGNVSLEHEAVTLEGLSIAQAVHNTGGTVVCQVKRLARRGSIHPQLVKIPGFLVDYFVVDEDQWQTNWTQFDPSMCGEVPRPLATIKPDPLTGRRVIARRAAFELFPGCVINLGVGVLSGIPNVVVEEDVEDLFTSTAEAGIIGGIPCSGLEFGAAYNPRAIIDQPYMFDFYDGGGLDVAFVSFAEVDAEGNVNVTRFGDRSNGCGGFIDITQNAKRIVFGGTLTGGGLKVAVTESKVRIEQEGSITKFVPRVQQISYRGPMAKERGQEVAFVSERAVFRLTPGGLVVTEIAPGVRLQEDVLDRVGFELGVAPDLRTMDARIFREGPMGLRDDILARQLAPGTRPQA